MTNPASLTADDYWVSWVPLPCTQLECTTSPVRLGGPWGPLVTPYLHEMQDLADLLGGYLPTASVCDAIVEASAVVCKLATRSPDATLKQSNDYSDEMTNQLFMKDWRPTEQIVSCGSKYPVLSAAPKPSGHYWIYGLHVPADKCEMEHPPAVKAAGLCWKRILTYETATKQRSWRVIQPPPPNGWSCGHNGAHREYDLHLTLVRPREGVALSTAMPMASGYRYE